MDVIGPGQNLGASAREREINRLGNRNVDFVSCDPTTLAIICVIQLVVYEGNQAREGKKVETDKVLARACRSARLPLFLIKAKSDFTLTEIRELISPVLEISAPRTTSYTKLIEEEERQERLKSLIDGEEQEQETIPLTPLELKKLRALKIKEAKKRGLTTIEFLDRLSEMGCTDAGDHEIMHAVDPTIVEDKGASWLQLASKQRILQNRSWLKL